MNISKSKTRRVSKTVPPEQVSVPPSVVPVTGAVKKRRRTRAAQTMACYHEDRHASIAEAAYYRSEQRGFAPGHELEDWLAAEEEVDQRLMGEGRAS